MQEIKNGIDRTHLDSIHLGQLPVPQISQSDMLELFKVITHTL